MSGLYNPNVSSGTTLLSHQTGLSAAIVTADVPVNIGTSISMPRSGILKISVKGHVGSTTGVGAVDFVLTRAGVAYYSVLSSSGTLTQSLFYNINTLEQSGITTTSPATLSTGYVYISSVGYEPIMDSYEIIVLANDIIQFRASNTSGGTTVYIDDMVLMLQ